MKSKRPKARPDDLKERSAKAGAVARGNRAAQMEGQDYEDFAQKKSYGGKMKKMAGGGMCRGMGAATKGGKYRMA
jgi:hypothetical protein